MISNFNLLRFVVLNIEKPELSICINYVRTSIDILNHHVQNFGRISSKLEKGDNIDEVISDHVTPLLYLFIKLIQTLLDPFWTS
jgi:hypothetical protein